MKKIVTTNGHARRACDIHFVGAGCYQPASDSATAATSTSTRYAPRITTGTAAGAAGARRKALDNRGVLKFGMYSINLKIA